MALQFEERDRVATLGDGYRVYQRSVPMLVPGLRPRQSCPVTHRGTPVS